MIPTLSNMKLLALLSATLSVTAQIVPRSEPKPLWSATVPSANYGNECKIYGQDTVLICSGSDGSTIGITPNGDSKGGKTLWKHIPKATTLSNTRSTSGVVFGSNPTIGNYVIHAVSEGNDFADPSYCVVYALSPDTGSVIWTSQALEGACSGTPVISGDGEYVFLTHNLLIAGHFSILSASKNGLPLYSQLDPNQPYAPPGIYFDPQEGYYPGGSGNSNDIVMWAYRPRSTETTVGSGLTMAFQFPIGFTGEATDLAITTLSVVTWQTITAPRLFNMGYSMMWGVSRSEFRVWNGGLGDTQHRFDKAATNTATFPRGDPKGQASFAALELSSSATEPMAFGGAASSVFAAFDSKLDEMWRLNTTFPIYAEARISPDDATVYFVEQNGRVHSIDVLTGKERWSALLGGVATTSNFAQSKSGKFLYFNNQGGKLQAWQVADAPSPAPSSSPSGAEAEPSVSPTRNPDSSTSLPSSAPSTLTTTLAPSSSSTSTTPVPSSTLLPSLTTEQPTFSPTSSNVVTRLPTAASTSRSPTSSAVSHPIVGMTILWVAGLVYLF